MSSSHYATVNGHQIYYEDYSQGRPLVLLHGGINTLQSSFEQQVPVFARRHRVIGVEQVGHGHTPDIHEPFSYSLMAEDTATLLQQLNIADADIVGWSDGGILGYMLGSRHPDLVRRLVIAGANLRASQLGEEAIKAMRERPIEQWVGPKDTWPEYYVKNSPDGPDHWPVVFGKDLAMWLTPVYMELTELTTIQARTLVVSGDHADIPFETTLETFRALPNAQLCILPGTTHWTTFRNAANHINSIILDFLDAP